ncbi:MAG: endonuclease NucS [Thermoprotei archaeon]|nr:MAG: endonuclease NucS [Thermoprotei archaeon]RLE89983.1 MAG: endonuclease NucS [Thermoprotei archaeon]
MSRHTIALESPTPERAVEILRKSILGSRTSIIVGRCIVKYRGRAESFLGEGDRVIILKPDGSLLVHKASKREPVNWNPPGSIHRVYLKEGKVIVESIRRRPRETIFIELSEVYFVGSFKLIDEECIMITGTEKDVVDIIFRSPEVIEKGFKPLYREMSTKYGKIDIFGVDEKGRAVVIEVKRRKADLSSVSQLLRYVESVRESTNSPVRGILVAPDCSASARLFLKSHNLEFRKVMFK